MKRIFLFTITVVILLSVTSFTVVGKSNDNSGQAKKEEKKDNQEKNINKNQTNNAENIQSVEKREEKKEEKTVNKNTKTVNKEKKETKLGALKLKDILARISTDSAYIASNDAKFKKISKIIVGEASGSAQMKRRAVSGIITNIAGEVITLSHQIKEARVYQILINENTVVKLKGINGATSADLAINQRIAAVGSLSENGWILAKRIHVIPGKAEGIFKRFPIATPTASLSVTPSDSATPSVTPDATQTLSPTVIPTSTEEITPVPSL